MTVTGSGFGAGVGCQVFFDTNGNGILDTGEPSGSVTANTDGTLPATVLTVPAVAAGDHSIRVIAGSMVVSATFTVMNPSIALSPGQGNAGTTVTVNGAALPAHPWPRVLRHQWQRRLLLRGAQPIST